MKATISFQDTDTGQVDVRVEAALTQPQLLAAPAAQQAAHPAPAEGDALSDEQIDALLSEIDDIARNVDIYEFGLPIADEPRAAMREAVRAALASKVQPKGTALTDRQISVIRYALLRFASQARSRADEAAQKTSTLPPEAVAPFLADAKDAEELRAMFAAPAQAPAPAPEAPAEHWSEDDPVLFWQMHKRYAEKNLAALGATEGPPPAVGDAA